MTIKDIAKECGCAVGTVSRVLNNHNYVSEETRQKVMEVVKKHNFVLNKNARELKASGSKTITIIVKGSENRLFYKILEVIQNKIAENHYNARTIILDEYDTEAKIACKIFYEEKTLGFIFLGGNPDRNAEYFSKIKVPCVLITTKPQPGNENLPNLSSVSIDEFQASLKIAQYFVKKGHTKFGIIGGDLECSETAKHRFAGFMEGLELENQKFDIQKSYASTRYTLEGGYVAAEELIKKFPEVTAIFCMSDVMAIGAMRKLKEMGKKVPEDVSIIGFDGIEISQYYCPRLTTVRQVAEDLAVQGLKTFVDSITKKTAAVHKTVSFEFIEGESVKNLTE